MSKREYALIAATMRALSPYWIGPEELTKVAEAVEAVRPDLDRIKLLLAIQPDTKAMS